MRAGRASGLAGTAQGPAMAVRLGQALMQCNILFAPHNPYSRRQVIAEGRRAPHVVQTGRNLLGRGLTFAKRQGSDLADRATLAYSKSYEWILRPTYFLRAPPMRARPAGPSRLVTATECSRTFHPDVDHTATVLNVVRKLTRFWCSKQGRRAQAAVAPPQRPGN